MLNKILSQVNAAFDLKISLLIFLCCALPACAESQMNSVMPPASASKTEVSDLTDETALSRDPAKMTFTDVNSIFHESYDNARKEILSDLGPVIICTGDSLTLLYKGTRKNERFIKDNYTRLKEISHITLGTYVVLINHTTGSIPDDVQNRLRRLRNGILAASENLPSMGLSEALLNRQRTIVEITLKFIDSVLAKKTVSREELRRYTRSVGKLDLGNAYDAVSSQLATINGIVNEWSKRFSKDEWNRLYVVIETGHMPRERQSSLQYFSKLLNQKREGLRIVTVETLASEDKALDLLLTHILDRQVAIDFFKDEWTMHRDLLSGGAKKYLSKQKPKQLGQLHRPHSN
jgi:hypothetical protein